MQTQNTQGPTAAAGSKGAMPPPEDQATSRERTLVRAINRQFTQKVIACSSPPLPHTITDPFSIIHDHLYIAGSSPPFFQIKVCGPVRNKRPDVLLAVFKVTVTLITPPSTTLPKQ